MAWQDASTSILRGTSPVQMPPSLPLPVREESIRRRFLTEYQAIYHLLGPLPGHHRKQHSISIPFQLLLSLVRGLVLHSALRWPAFLRSASLVAVADAYPGLVSCVAIR